MPNRLANQNSPYLLQHADNPVDWYPWGEEALVKARDEDKPIFLSVGYAACHWCHVMAHESFEDQETAAILNKNFVNIKVDREERPDIDSIYMTAVVTITRQGGWPMSVFLTPEGQPFFGGTYFPPVRRYNMPSFKEVLNSVINLWEGERAKILTSAHQLTQYLQDAAVTMGSAGQIDSHVLSEAVTRLGQNYDWEYGGWGQAPKFPQPMVIEFLLRQATRGNQQALKMAEHALQAMAKGGMYDVVGGGFARYSVDNFWLVPHFEKMLYDNAQLALVYLHAYLITKNEDYCRVCQETLDYVSREMTHPLGGFFSSMDADSEGVEGKFYLWTPAAVEAALQNPQEVTLFNAVYGMTSDGNFEGQMVLQRRLTNEQIAAEFNLPASSVTAKLSELHRKLLAYRSRRVRPATDDKVLVSWNALMLQAFAEAGRYLNRKDYTRFAARNADFLLSNLRTDNRLQRSWRDGHAAHNAYLEDHAALILGLVALYQADPQTRWFTHAVSLAEEILAHFQDPSGGFYDTRHDQQELILRPKDVQDNATPSGNALTALALLQLSAYTNNLQWRSLAEQMLQGMVKTALQYPTSFGQWLTALDFSVGPVQEAALLGEQDSPAFQALVAAVHSSYRPRLVAAFSSYPPDPNGPAILENRPLLNEQPTAYICHGFVCQQPATSPEAVSVQLVTGTIP